VRPNEYVRFKKISLEEAFSAIFRTDALIDTLTAMAHGTITLEQGQSKMDAFKVCWGRAPQQPHPASAAARG
jgi:hypothetical protein